MRTTKLFLIVLATAAGLVLAGALGGAVVVYGGLYEIAATRQHWQITHSALEMAMRQSVRLRARGIEEPALADDRRALRGAACFQKSCVQCHGAPGIAPEDIGKSMQPLPGPLVEVDRHWRPRELYWLVRHGLKMTGMPAWEHRLSDAEIWDVVAFMQHLPQLNAGQYAQWQQRALGDSAAASCGQAAVTKAQEPPSRTPDARRGRQALHQYACTGCHSIPGVTGPETFVGPPLDGFARRELIAGALPNTPANLARWLMQTQQVKSGTAMPELGVTDRDAQDMAAFLLSLH